jgi:hypothetical protein
MPSAHDQIVELEAETERFATLLNAARVKTVHVPNEMFVAVALTASSG